jgi:hypothetical protein
MDTSQQNNTFEKQPHDNELDIQAASFKKTYESIEALFGSKIARLIASKNLIAAEAKLSLSAVLLSFAISLTLVVIAAVVWILLNIGVGLIVYKLIQSLSLSIILLLIINTSLGLWLFSQLRKIWDLVGFHTTVAKIAEGE